MTNHRNLPQFTSNGFKKVKMPEKLHSLLIETRDNYLHEIVEEEIDENRSQFCHYSYNENGNLGETFCLTILIFWTNFCSLKNVPERKSTQSIITMPKEVRNQIIKIMRPLLKDWSGQEFSENESDIKLYGIRRYFRNARLALHVDEFPRVIAAILQVTFDSQFSN